MNEPQLSEELEKRFDEEFPNEESGYLNKQGEYVHLFNPAVDSREIKTFLATALEEQRDLFRSWVTEGEMEMFTADGLADFLYKKLNGEKARE